MLHVMNTHVMISPSSAKADVGLGGN